jgi:hypothetical protein
MQFSFDTKLNKIAAKVEGRERLFEVFFNFRDEIF